jgi:hypothetical protein
LEKDTVRKIGMVGKEYKGEENSPSLPSVGKSQAGMTAVGPCSLYWLREGSWCGRLNSNSIGKRCCEKKLEWGE